MKGRRQVKEGFLSLEAIETWIVHVCHSEVELARQNICPFERSMVVGAMHPGLGVSRTTTLLGFSQSTVSCVYEEWSATQRTSRQIDTTVGSFGVNMGQHPCGTLSTPCRGHAPNSTLGRCS